DSIYNASAASPEATLFSLHRNDVNPIWVLGMYHHGETKIRRDAIGNVLPVFGIVIGAIQAPVILKEKTFGTGRMHRNLVYTLPELGILVGHKHSADASISRRPRTSAIVGPVNATG